LEYNLPSESRRRWFATSILYQTSGLEYPAYVVQIVDEHYQELYNETLSVEELKMFERMIVDNEYAILYKNHPKLRKAAFIKMEWTGQIEYL
jgi:hypothetical protein